MLTTLPNLLTILRVLLVPVMVGCFYLPEPANAWATFGTFTLASLTDYFDGYFARVRDQTSAFGRFLDPIADKLLVAAAILMLVAMDRIVGVTVIAGLVILCRELTVSGLREFLAADRVVVHVTVLAKWKTFFQMGALGLLLMAPAVHPYVGLAGVALLWLAAILTLYTGLGYLSAGLSHMSARDKKAETRASGAS